MGKSAAPTGSPEAIVAYYREQRKSIDLDNDPEKRAEMLENLRFGLELEMEEFQEHGRLSIPRDEDGYRTDKPEYGRAFREAFNLSDSDSVPRNLISDLLDMHMKEISSRVNNQTAATRENRVNAFIDWFGDKDITAVTKRKAGDYVTQKVVVLDRSVKTKKDLVSDLSTFFNWCVDRGQIEVNPFMGLSKTIRGSTKGSNDKRRAFTEAELVNLLTTIKEKRGVNDPLWAMTVIALFTGMRSGEIAESECSDVYEDYIHIPESKTEAGRRDVPLHPVIKPLVKQLLENPKDGYLIPGLKRGGADMKRNHVIGKRFSTILRSEKGAGIIDKNVVFHSLRKNMSTALENAKVPESTAQQIIGHEKGSMTYGLYSQGVSMDVLKHEVAKVGYGAEVQGLVADG